jgi:hypothetical protein
MRCTEEEDDMTTMRIKRLLLAAAAVLTFTAVSAGGAVKASYLDEVLAALNDVRVASGSGTVTWGQILQPQNQPPLAPATGGVVYGEHLMALRRQMEAAIAALAPFGAVLPSFNYTDPALPGSPPVLIKLIHLQELRGRTQ